MIQDSLFIFKPDAGPSSKYLIKHYYLAKSTTTASARFYILLSNVDVSNYCAWLIGICRLKTCCYF